MRETKEAMMLELTTEEGATRQGMWMASRSWKGRGTDSPLEPPEGTQPSQHLNWPREADQTSDLQRRR